MQRIALATDFSTRSDRALRRSILLARQFSAEIVLVHAVDDDQPPRLVAAEQGAADVLLSELAATLRSVDGVDCETRVVLGEPFQAIAEAAERVNSDILVMGPHRRQALRDVFIGTTVERTIRESRRPVIMANALPAGRYDRVLIATDLSECSERALMEAGRLGLLDCVETLVFHAYDAPARSMMGRAAMTADELNDYIADEEDRAGNELSEFLQRVDLLPSQRFIELIEAPVYEMVRECVRKQKVDLIVMGTHGRTGASKFFLGSVAEEVLRYSDVDVLIVPSDSGAIPE
ncbi:universal stress protein [Novosphingobium pentaromativorans]|uniref:universal stress protein n=1 Tax=Novosphingobium pentaromativorans TaxID=205844 RepID=UPI0002FBAD42|nr:universal stress protein [Novosphingobium pentaromativorans]